jgi:hypothetical protein
MKTDDLLFVMNFPNKFGIYEPFEIAFEKLLKNGFPRSCSKIKKKITVF